MKRQATNAPISRGATTLDGTDDTQTVAPALTIEERSERERRDKVATAAYYLALARGFAPGNELDDWLAAELAVEQGRVARDV